MPIRPDLRGLYPPDWPEISRRIRFGRAGGRCEACGRPHGKVVCALPDGRWVETGGSGWRSAAGIPAPDPTGCELLLVRFVAVVLTTAHLDHDPAHNADENLAAWCSRCHILFDAPHHRAQRRLTHRAGLAVGDLFDGTYGLLDYPRNARL